MGVRVRLSRNTSMYLPFWVAIPVWLVAAAVWVVIGLVFCLVWLVTQGVKLAGGRTDRRLNREYKRPENVAAREVAQAISAAAEADRKSSHDRRTYRAKVSACHVDGVKGGSFLISAEGRTDVEFMVSPADALHFLSLKNGDIVQLTMSAGDVPGLDEFWHLSRANGARPRNPVNFGPGMVRQ